MQHMAGCARLARRCQVAFWFLLLPSAGLASSGIPPHTGLKASDPAKDSRIDIAPTRVVLWFTALPQLAFSKIRLVGPSGEIQLARIVADTGNALRAEIPQALGPGQYRVIWQTASADGHPIRGAFGFTLVGATPGTAVAAQAMDTQRASTTGAPATIAVLPDDQSEYRTARWFEFVALLTVLGALGFRHGVLPPLAARSVPTADAADRARRLGTSVLVLYAVAAAVRLYTESVALNTREHALEPGVLLPLLTSTTWGVGWLTGIVGALLVLVGWTTFKKSVALGTPLALTGALGMVLSPALSGHAAASQTFVISVTLDMLHVAAAGAWIGGLLMLLIVGVPAMRRLSDGNTDAAVSALVNSFHPIALFCAPIVVAAGLGTSWIRLGGFGAITSTQYGLQLLVKVAFFAMVAGMGTYNSMRARKQLGAPRATLRIRRTMMIELMFAALVLVATTFLVASPVPTEMVAP